MRRSARGFTLIELMIAIAINAIVVGNIVVFLVGVDRLRLRREVVSRMQGDGRAGLTYLEEDLRLAALGVATGVVWQDAGGVRASRPAVQLYNDVPGGGFIPVKPRTDVLLVARADRGAAAVTVGEHHQSTSDINVSAVGPFAARVPVLLGNYEDAAWDVINAINGTALDLASTVNVLPGRQGQSTKLPAGSFVRRARAFLYYVNTRDQLVRLELRVPRAPAADADLGRHDVLAEGVENLQLDCETDNGGGLTGCPGAIAIADPVSTEAAAALGALAAGQGPRLTAQSIPTLRTVALALSVRSREPLQDGVGDAKIALDGKQLPVGGKPDGSEYVRRAYRLSLAIRNVSLEVL